MSPLSFFDQENRLAKLNQHDRLLVLNNLIDWELFRNTLESAFRKEKKSSAGRKPYDAVMMFKGLILQHLYNLSDAELEFQIRDRLTFSRFVGMGIEQNVPDGNTFWDFREQLVRANVLDALFLDFDYLLDQQGFKAEKGQIVDASFIEAPRQRNSKDQNAKIKQGETPEDFLECPAKLSQKDLDARWAKKNNETHYGYKNHINIDNQHKLIRAFKVTSAEVHDSQVFVELLVDNADNRVWADSAYQSEDTDVALTSMGYQNCVHERAYRNSELTTRQHQNNKKKSKIRARVEHVFGTIKNSFDGGHVRVIGLSRTQCKMTLTNLVYNITRYEYLTRISTP
jgi:transposase, IS5 family